MKRTVKYIVIMLVVLAVLGGGVFLLTIVPAEESGEEVSSSVETSQAGGTIILEGEFDQVQSLLVEGKEDSFTLVPAKGGEEFTLEGYEDHDLNRSLISANVRTMLGITSSKDLGKQDNLDNFGLGADATKLTVQFAGGEAKSLLVGNDAGESVGKYVLKDGEVYIVSGLPANFFSNRYSYFNTAIYTISDRTEITEDEDGNSSESKGLDILYSMTLSGKQYPEPISIEFTSETMSGYIITSPIRAESGNTAFNELVTSLKSLTAETVVAANLTDQVLEEYGLLEPEAEITFDLNDSEHTLAVSGKTKEGKRYLLADGKNVVYQVGNDVVEKWASADLITLRMSYIWIPNIMDVEKLTITLDGNMVHTFHITRTLDEENSTDTNKQYNLAVTNASGETVDYKGTYQPFYQKLIGLAVFSQEKAAYSGTPQMKITYEYFDGGSDTVELYKIKDQDRYAAVLNGGYNGQIRGTEYDALGEMIP